MTRHLRGLVPAALLLLLLAACAGQPDRPAAHPPGPAPGSTSGPATGPAISPGLVVPVPAPAPRDGAVRQVGLASWYGDRFHGRLTASGEPYDMHALTAAHPSLPFGTRVRVTNLANGRSVVLRINDRGPFVKPRIIDLSRRAAEHLGFLGDGLAQVRVEVI